MSDWPDDHTWRWVAAVSRALLGEGSPDLRAVAVSGERTDVMIRLVFEIGPPSERRREQMQDLAWDVEADAGSSLHTDSVVEETDGPLELRAGETWVFMRREPYV